MKEAKQGKRQSFTDWLRAQRENDDRIGDLARDMLHDSSWPQKAGTKLAFRQHLKKMHACDEALDALDAAWRSYTKSENT